MVFNQGIGFRLPVALQMETKAVKIIQQLAKKVIGLPQPIHIVAVCSGGKTVGKYIKRYLVNQGIKSNYFEVWTNIMKGQAKIWRTDFKKSNYIGTALIVEDVIWKGTSVNATKKMLMRMKKKRVYTAVLLDYNHKADFSVFN